MANNKWENLINKILNALLYPEFKYIQDLDEINEAVVRALVAQIPRAGKHSWIRTVQTVIDLHKAVLFKEVIMDGTWENIDRILDILSDVRDNDLVKAYLLTAPNDLKNHIKSLAKFKKQIVLYDPADADQKAEELKKRIAKFLEQE